jgi:hypothetical protein
MMRLVKRFIVERYLRALANKKRREASALRLSAGYLFGMKNNEEALRANELAEEADREVERLDAMTRSAKNEMAFQ